MYVARLRAGDGGGVNVPDHAAAPRPPEGRHGQGGDVRLHRGQGGGAPHQAPGQQSLVQRREKASTPPNSIFTIKKLEVAQFLVFGESG